MHRQPHSPYYRDRDSEYDLCNDFPGDEILIYGLHAMQAHFYNNGRFIDIPVLRVMNTVHYIAAYMFSTDCSGDQMEYDVLAYDSFGRDKQLVPLTMIVLAAMLKRTEGFRAKQCRNLILENRPPDFEEGVLLYDNFLRSAQAHFAEEDFLIDVNALVTRVQDQNKQIAQLTSENIQLKYTITTMEHQQNIQYNNCVIYNAPVYNTSTTNNYYPQQTPSEDSSFASDNLSDSPSSPDPDNRQDSILPIPGERKYTEVRRYIEERCRFDEEFKNYVESHSRVDLCQRLSKEFGWYVDEHHLGVNMSCPEIC